ncbi:MAG: hypothetical protein C0614_10390, partial [Desulfuromonas sp.]
TALSQDFIAVDDNNKGVTQDGTVLYPYASLQSAINAASSGDSIRVAGGIYLESLEIRNKQLHLYGGYTGAESAAYQSGSGGDFTSRNLENSFSRLQGDGSAPVILLVLDQTRGSSIDGFVITDGNRGIVLDSDETWPYLSDITITNNLIEYNQSDGFGGGLFLSGQRITLKNNLIRNNSAGFGAGLAGSVINLQMTNNHIIDNQIQNDHGGGMFMTATGRIDSNLFQGNDVGTLAGYGWGGGAIIIGRVEDDNGSLVNEPVLLSNNTFTGNHAESQGGGIFIDEGAMAVLQNNLVVRNTSGEGGAGIYVDGAGTSDHSDLRSEATIINCTVADNASSGYDGNGLMVQYSDVTVTNSLFWGNGDDFSVVDDEHGVLGTLSVNYSLSDEIFSGMGNVTVDPLFVSSSGGDYHLRSTTGRWNVVTETWTQDSVQSPAIDAGDPASDYSLEPLENGGRINMGAYGNTVEASQSPRN